MIFPLSAIGSLDPNATLALRPTETVAVDVYLVLNPDEPVDSTVGLNDVEIIGEAGSSTPVDLAPGETTSGKYHLAGVSQKGGRFTPPDGQPVEEYQAE